MTAAPPVAAPPAAAATPTAGALAVRLAPAAQGPVSFRVEIAGGDGAVAVIHVYGAYDCKGTEAEIDGLLRGCGIGWRIVWH